MLGKTCQFKEKNTIRINYITLATYTVFTYTDFSHSKEHKLPICRGKEK
jgi:hypothetical protein